MNVEHPRFPEYQEKFEALANKVDGQKGPQPEISSAHLFLCLYGDNAMNPEEEFAMLAELAQHVGEGLQKTTIQTAYWEELILYVPKVE